MVSETAEDLAQRLRREANERDYVAGDLLCGDPPDLAAQLTPEARKIIEAWIEVRVEE